MTRNVLVTGGLGYIGGRIACYLAEMGWRVRLTSRRMRPPPKWPFAMELVPARFPLDEPADRLCHGMDAIVHLATPNEIQSQANPAHALVATAAGTWQLLEAAKHCKVGRFLFFSTMHVYGEPLDGRIDEQRLPRPNHPYAIAHRAAEDYVLASLRRGDITGAVVRLSNVVGPPAHVDVDRWTLLVNDLCRQAARGQPLVLKSSGLQIRNFVPMEDVIRAVEHLLNTAQPGLGDGIINLGGEESMTVLAMAEKVVQRCEQTLGHRPALQHPAPGPKEIIRSMDFRSDRLRASGYRPSGNIEVEIDATLRFCAGHFSDA